MRLYISGPMSNIADHNFPSFFQCEQEVERMGYQPLNPARRYADDTWEIASADVLSNPESWESCIRRDVAMVLNAEGIVLMPNWHSSRGACLELILSMSIGNTTFIWFPGELEQVEETSLYYSLALDHLKVRGTISPLDMYNGQRTALY